MTQGVKFLWAFLTWRGLVDVGSTSCVAAATQDTQWSERVTTKCPWCEVIGGQVSALMGFAFVAGAHVTVDSPVGVDHPPPEFSLRI